MHYYGRRYGLLGGADEYSGTGRVDECNDKEASAGVVVSVSNLEERRTCIKYIATNMVANICGLGWAATPAGLEAMKELKKVQESDKSVDRRSLAVASDEMCAFLIINISSLQLIPVNIIAYRTQYDSPDPTAIVGPAIVATCISTGIAIIFIKIMQLRRKGRG